MRNSELCESQLQIILATERARELISSILYVAFGGGCILARWLSIPQCQGGMGQDRERSTLARTLTPRTKCCEFIPHKARVDCFEEPKIVNTVNLLKLMLQSDRSLFSYSYALDADQPAYTF
jgi:hypothetical protein